MYNLRAELVNQENYVTRILRERDTFLRGERREEEERIRTVCREEEEHIRVQYRSEAKKLKSTCDERGLQIKQVRHADISFEIFSFWRLRKSSKLFTN